MISWKPAILSITPFGTEFDRNFIVESRTGGGRYTVNLHTYTCTCPDFLERRGSRPVGDLGRSCKHLRDAVLSLDHDAFGDELTRVIFKSPHGPYDVIWFAPGPEDGMVAVGLRNEIPWMSLFVRGGKGKPYTRYGYNPGENRWSYNSVPPSSQELLAMIQHLPGTSVPG